MDAKRNWSRLILVWLAWAGCAAAARGGAVELARVAATPAIAAELPRSAAERAILHDATSGRLDARRLLEASMATSGKRDDWPRLDARLAAAAGQVDRALPAAERARRVFDVLHTQLLRGVYREQASDVATAIDGGAYNCLAAAIVFMDLAERTGLSARGVLGTSHVACRVDVGPAEAPLHVEPTCPQWFTAVGARRPIVPAAGANGTTSWRPLSMGETLALVYFNRGVERLQQGEFAAAAADNLTALRLDANNAGAAANLLATLNNWAVERVRHGDTPTARALIHLGRTLAPDHPWLRSNEAYVSPANSGNASTH